MSILLNNIVTDDFLWDALQSHLPSARSSSTQFKNFDCPMCTDKRKRCGIRRDERIGIYCFNCGFRTIFQPGELLSHNLQKFLSAIGVAETDIQRLNIRARAVRRVLEDSGVEAPVQTRSVFIPDYPDMELPAETKRLSEWLESGCDDPHLEAVCEYAISRGDTLLGVADYHWCNSAAYRDRLIIPFYYEGRTVGYTARLIGPGQNKYLNHMPLDFIFNSRALTDDTRDVVIIVEGVLDALAIDGVSSLGARMNENQVAWIKQSGKKVIVVPDRDDAGKRLIDIARSNQWAVSFPAIRSNNRNWWDDDIKDCDAAVVRHGRLYTLRAILENATTNGTEIALKREKLV